MSPAGAARRPGPQSDVPVLRSLGPTYEKDLHGRHAAVLLAVLANTSGNVAKNIALAGHYGSGKSSVILGVQAGLDKRKINWVNLSLSSLGVDDTTRARIQEDGSLAPLTNLIQKEIVKQLLYRKSPQVTRRDRPTDALSRATTAGTADLVLVQAAAWRTYRHHVRVLPWAARSKANSRSTVRTVGGLGSPMSTLRPICPGQGTSASTRSGPDPRRRGLIRRYGAVATMLLARRCCRGPHRRNASMSGRPSAAGTWPRSGRIHSDSDNRASAPTW